MPGAQPVACPQAAPALDLTPFLNTTGRLFMLLTQLDGILPPVRDLARRLGCSIGAISGGLRELEVDGYITRDGRAFTIVNTCVQSAEHVQEYEQNVQENEQSAAPADRITTPSSAEGDQNIEQCVQKNEPPHTPHNGTLASSSSSCARPLENDLIAAGVAASLARTIADRCPDRTIAQFQEQIALARSRGKRSPLGLIVTLWSDGRILQPDEEARDDGRSDISPYHGRRSAAARPDQRAGRGPAEPGVIRNFADLVW